MESLSKKDLLCLEKILSLCVLQKMKESAVRRDVRRTISLHHVRKQ